MSEIVCQLWPQLVSHLALQKERREKGSGQSKFFKNCLFASEEGSGRSSWQKGDECGGSRARHLWAHGLVTSRHCGLRPGEPRVSGRLSLTTREARRAITSAAEVTTVECWSLRNTYRVSDLCLVVWAPRSYVHRESSVIYVRQAPW